jgi:hypothetical protein
MAGKKALERKKQLAMRTATREVARLLDPGERVSAVIPTHEGVHPDRRYALAIAFYLTLAGSAFFVLFHDRRPTFGELFLMSTVTISVAVRIAGTATVALRRLVLTDRRVLLIGQKPKGWRPGQVIRGQVPIDRVRVDAVRPAFPRRISFGLRRGDGSTTQIFLRKQWLPEVEWLASCLDVGVAAPRRPDVLSA